MSVLLWCPSLPADCIARLPWRKGEQRRQQERKKIGGKSHRPVRKSSFLFLDKYSLRTVRTWDLLISSSGRLVKLVQDIFMACQVCFLTWQWHSGYFITHCSAFQPIQTVRMCYVCACGWGYPLVLCVRLFLCGPKDFIFSQPSLLTPVRGRGLTEGRTNLSGERKRGKRQQSAFSRKWPTVMIPGSKAASTSRRSQPKWSLSQGYTRGWGGGAVSAQRMLGLNVCPGCLIIVCTGSVCVPSFKWFRLYVSHTAAVSRL